MNNFDWVCTHWCNHSLVTDELPFHMVIIEKYMTKTWTLYLSFQIDVRNFKILLWVDKWECHKLIWSLYSKHYLLNPKKMKLYRVYAIYGILNQHYCYSILFQNCFGKYRNTFLRLTKSLIARNKAIRDYCTVWK